MANFHLVTRNWIARRGIINKLISLGYKCVSGFTSAQFEERYPANEWPVVIAADEANGEKNVIDLRAFCHPLTEYCGEQISPAQLDQKVANKKKQAADVAFPPAAKYDVTYMKADGKVGKYTVSNPIEANSESITVYSFKDARNPGSKPGLKTFNKARIRSLRPLSQIRAS